MARNVTIVGGNGQPTAPVPPVQPPNGGNGSRAPVPILKKGGGWRRAQFTNGPMPILVQLLLAIAIIYYIVVTVVCLFMAATSSAVWLLGMLILYIALPEGLLWWCRLRGYDNPPPGKEGIKKPKSEQLKTFFWLIPIVEIDPDQEVIRESRFFGGALDMIAGHGTSELMFLSNDWTVPSWLLVLGPEGSRKILDWPFAKIKYILDRSGFEVEAHPETVPTLEDNVVLTVQDTGRILWPEDPIERILALNAYVYALEGSTVQMMTLLIRAALAEVCSSMKVADVRKEAGTKDFNKKVTDAFTNILRDEMGGSLGIEGMVQVTGMAQDARREAAEQTEIVRAASQAQVTGTQNVVESVKGAVIDVIKEWNGGRTGGGGSPRGGRGTP